MSAAKKASKPSQRSAKKAKASGSAKLWWLAQRYPIYTLAIIVTLGMFAYVYGGWVTDRIANFYDSQRFVRLQQDFVTLNTQLSAANNAAAKWQLIEGCAQEGALSDKLSCRVSLHVELPAGDTEQVKKSIDAYYAAFAGNGNFEFRDQEQQLYPDLSAGIEKTSVELLNEKIAAKQLSADSKGTYGEGHFRHAPTGTSQYCSIIFSLVRSDTNGQINLQGEVTCGADTFAVPYKRI